MRKSVDIALLGLVAILSSCSLLIETQLAWTGDSTGKTISLEKHIDGDTQVVLAASGSSAALFTFYPWDCNERLALFVVSADESKFAFLIQGSTRAGCAKGSIVLFYDASDPGSPRKVFESMSDEVASITVDDSSYGYTRADGSSSSAKF
jgi:hypothetical protein